MARRHVDRIEWRSPRGEYRDIQHGSDAVALYGEADADLYKLNAAGMLKRASELQEEAVDVLRERARPGVAARDLPAFDDALAELRRAAKGTKAAAILIAQLQDHLQTALGQLPEEELEARP